MYWGVDVGLRALGIAGLVSPTQLVFTELIQPPARYKAAEKFTYLYEKIQLLAQTYPPHGLCIETPFVGKNPHSALQLGRVEGLFWSLSAQMKIPLFTYTPAEIKKSLTGNPYAPKTQLQGFLTQYLRHTPLPQIDHLTDAIGVALCHFFRNHPRFSHSPAEPKDN